MGARRCDRWLAVASGLALGERRIACLASTGSQCLHDTGLRVEAGFDRAPAGAVGELDQRSGDVSCDYGIPACKGDGPDP